MGFIRDLLAVVTASMHCLYPCKNSQMGAKRMDFGVTEVELNHSLTMIDVRISIKRGDNSKGCLDSQRL